jgi:hypothetical protein
LFPDASLLKGTGFNKGSASSTGYWPRNFKLADTDSSWGSRHDLFYAEDTTSSPSGLMSQSFDSAIIYIHNPDSTVILLKKDFPASSSMKNPYRNDSAWSKYKLRRTLIHPDWNGFYYVNVFNTEIH